MAILSENNVSAAVDEVIDPENNSISDFNKGLHQQGWYNTTQNVANFSSALFGGFYSIGLAYNAFKAAQIKGGSEIVDDVIEGGSSAVETAQSWQGSGRYPGVDDWSPRTYNKGD